MNKHVSTFKPRLFKVLVAALTVGTFLAVTPVYAQGKRLGQDREMICHLGDDGIFEMKNLPKKAFDKHMANHSEDVLPVDGTCPSIEEPPQFSCPCFQPGNAWEYLANADVVANNWSAAPVGEQTMTTTTNEIFQDDNPDHINHADAAAMAEEDGTTTLACVSDDTTENIIQELTESPESIIETCENELYELLPELAF